jgi:hypothetical protein
MRKSPRQQGVQVFQSVTSGIIMTVVEHLSRGVLNVGACDSSITDVCDESGSATSWIKVVSKKRKNKADGLMVATNLGGKQSEKLEKLTLFTKSKLAKQ